MWYQSKVVTGDKFKKDSQRRKFWKLRQTWVFCKLEYGRWRNQNQIVSDRNFHTYASKTT